MINFFPLFSVQFQNYLILTSTDLKYISSWSKGKKCIFMSSFQLLSYTKYQCVFYHKVQLFGFISRHSIGISSLTVSTRIISHVWRWNISRRSIRIFLFSRILKYLASYPISSLRIPWEMEIQIKPGEVLWGNVIFRSSEVYWNSATIIWMNHGELFFLKTGLIF